MQMVKAVYFKHVCNTNLVLGTQCKLESYSYPQESVFEEKIRSIELFLYRGIQSYKKFGPITLKMVTEPVCLYCVCNIGNILLLILFSILF